LAKEVYLSPIRLNNISHDIFIQKDNALDLKLQRNYEHLEDIMDTILKDKLIFSFSDYMKSLFRYQTKSCVLFLNTTDNLHLIMNIERYLKFNLDMNLVKEVVFDESQRHEFDTASNLLNLKKFFDINNEKYIDFFKKEDFEIFFTKLNSMFSRHNDIDN
jgi:hypothetical protein